MKRIRKLFLPLLAAMLVSALFALPSMAASSSTVAKIGSTKYTSLEAAVKKVKSGQTITLQKNVSYSDVLTISRSGKSFVLNLNEHVITFKGESAYLYVKAGTVTIKNGTIKQTATTGKVLKASSKATVKISSGTYRGMITNAGTMTVTGGTFVSNETEKNVSTALITNTGKLTIKKGTFKGKKNGTVINKGTLTISGGTFTDSMASESDVDFKVNEDGAMFANLTSKGKLTITGGTFSSYGRLLWNSAKSTVIIRYGNFTSKYNFIASTCGKMTVTGGTFKIPEIEDNKQTQPIFYVVDEGTLVIKHGVFKGANDLVEVYDNATVIISGGQFTETGESAIFLLFGGKTTITGSYFKAVKGYLYERYDPAILENNAGWISVLAEDKNAA
ncbi:MAG: autotransporter adhesin family protein [Clostridiales bacterium]|nr:autotransporter adhesin family protein [Clostridiales bacterium]